MRVRVVENINMLHKGNKYGYGEIIEDYTGVLNKYIQRIVEATEVKEVPQFVQPKASTLMETVSEAPVESEFYATLGDVDPEDIKAKIEEIESQTTQAVVETSSTVEMTKDAPEVEVPIIPEINVVEVKRGWYEVQDVDGNVLSEKKMRRDDAETLRDQLYNQ